MIMFMQMNIKKTKGNHIINNAVCDRHLLFGQSEKYEVAKQLLHPKWCNLIFSEIINTCPIIWRNICKKK
jgi:hypothetical protein